MAEEGSRLSSEEPRSRDMHQERAALLRERESLLLPFGQQFEHLVHMVLLPAIAQSRPLTPRTQLTPCCRYVLLAVVPGVAIFLELKARAFVRLRADMKTVNRGENW